MKMVFVGMVAGLLVVSGVAFAAEPYCDQLFLTAVKADNLQDTRVHLGHDGGNVNVKDPSTGETALIIAVKNQNYDMVRLLLDGANVNVNLKDNNGMTALMYSIKEYWTTGAEMLLKENNLNINFRTERTRYTALHYAVEAGAEDIARSLLLDSRINTGSVDTQGRTAFMLAVERGDLSLIRYFARSRYFDVTQIPDDGVPPLLYAIESGMPLGIIAEILDCPHAILSVDDKGRDAFEYAAAFASNNQSLQRILEQAKARENF